LKRIWVDAGYAGAFVDWAQQTFGWVAEVVKRHDTHRLVVLPKRWIVERTFGWFGKYRRLSKDYETLPSSSAGGSAKSVSFLLTRSRHVL
jgi:putative transposase